MLDISISSTKTNGRPKGRPAGKHNQGRLVFPYSQPYSNWYLKKLAYWRTSSIVRQIKKQGMIASQYA